MAWQLQEAKQKFSEVVDRALSEGPQVVTRHGEEVAVVLSAEDFRKLAARKRDFKKFLSGGPSFAKLKLERRRDLPRDVEL